jgi:hypothetical protein
LISPIIFDEQYKSWSSSLCNFLQYPVTASHLGPNIFLSTLFLNTISWCFSLHVTFNSHPYKTMGKIIGLYTLTSLCF